MKNTIRCWVLLLVAFWCGAAVMAFELAVGRLLAPHYGAGIDVWAVVIATTMGALAIGYLAGGFLADVFPRGYAVGFLLLGAGLILFLVYVFHGQLPATFLSRPHVTGLCLSACTVLVAPLFFLAAVEPFLVRLLMCDIRASGRVFGRITAANTLGGVAGCLTTGLYVLPSAGVSATLLVVAGTVLILGILQLIVAGKAATAGVTSLVCMAVPCAIWVWRPPLPTNPDVAILATVESRYGQINVIESNGTRAMRCNGIIQSALPISMPDLMRGDLIRGGDFIELIPYYRPEAEKALLIGAGGGLHARALASYGIETACVEIDSAVVRLAQKYFFASADTTIADGRAFLARDTHTYDAIVIDAFSGSALPEHLFTVEAFRTAAARLSPKGILAIHLIAPPRHRVVQAVTTTLKRAFPNVTSLVARESDIMQNIYLFASRAPLELPLAQELAEARFSACTLPDPPDDNGLVLTDDRSDLSLIGFDIATALRQNQNRQLPPR